MDAVLRATLVKVAVPVLVIAIALIASRRARLAWGPDLGLTPPAAGRFLTWIAVWAAWVAVGELAIRAFGMDQAKPWVGYSATVVALRILAIGILGPVSEELVMRGLLYARLSRTRLGTTGAILVCAVAWALMHTSYGWKTLVMIFLDGVLLGFARRHSRSVLTPMAMHVLGNLFSIAQSLTR